MVMVTCEQCGKQLKNPQGLRGHLQFAHKIPSPRSGDAAVEHATLATVAQLEELRAATVEQLAQAGEQLRAATASLVSAAAGLPKQLGSAEQRQVIEGSDLVHGPGLCGSGQCAPCRDSRKVYGPVVWRQARKALLQEIDVACEKAGVTAERNHVAQAVLAHRAKQQGEVDPEPLDALTTVMAPDPESVALATASPDPEPDALATIMASDPVPLRPEWPY